MGTIFGRQISLFVGTGGVGLELAPADADVLSIKFSIQQWDLQTPNRAQIRVRNLSDATAKQIENEFTQIILQAGYAGGNYGVIFQGTIVQVRRGRESAPTTYTDIIACDGDLQANFAMVNISLAAGSTFAARAKALAQAMGTGAGYIAPGPASALPRGKVMYGMARDHLRDLAFSNDMAWSIQNGALNIVPVTGYLPGEAVVLNSATGLIGFPEQTQQGITARSLLNPRFQPHGRVQINNADIQQATLNLGYQSATENAFLPSTTDDGIYRIVVCEHTGETRGNDWYTNLICIAGDQPVTPSLAARGYS